MPEIKNNFLKGRMNQDLDSRILPQGEYREAINLLISRSEGSTVGEFENILGNTNVGTIASNKKANVIGSCVDETNNRVYIFATDFSNDSADVRAPSTSTCLIIEFDLSNPGSPTTLVSGHFLNFNKKFPIYGVNIIEELLFFTDNLNQPRRINITTARNAPATSQGPAYTEEAQLSVARYYPYNVIVPIERSTATYSSGAGTTTLVVTQAQPNVKVGDILSDNNKGPGATELFVGPTNTQGVITVTKVNSTTNFTVSEALPNPIPAGFKIDFSRTSMKNVHDSLLPNHSTQKIKDVIGNPSTIVRIGVFNDQANYPVNFGGIPRVGDIVTNLTNPGATPAGLRITQVKINSTPGNPSTSPGRIWQLHFDQAHGMSVDDNIQIAHNPDFEAGAPGDPKFLDDKFVRFSYRYRFNDNEYSLMAPFSQIMFIPKQFGQFNLGQVDGLTSLQVDPTDSTRNRNYYQDEKDSYTSTVIEWFENNVDTIDLKIPLPDTKDNLRQNFDVKEIDILYKESDALAVKVIDTLSVDDIQNTQVSTIEYDDPIHGIVGQKYLDYRYKSTKPYKTLPQNQTTRVYDKVPIRALAQETTSNRVIYGNILERMTPPESIKYSVGFSGRKVISDYYTQYPYHSVKSNRTYQVGFVLADYYGRQSDVILSTYDNNTQLDGSSVFVPYKTEASNTNNKGVLGYIGENLTLTIDEEIASTANASIGAPGIYKDVGHVASVLAITDDDSGYVAGKTYKTSGGSGTGCTVVVTSVNAGAITGIKIMTSGKGYTQGNELTVTGGGGAGTFTVNVGDANPLGWYSYKVVVKQQEQEYYNVYLPGFVNGYPVQDRTGGSGSFVFNETQRGKISFATLIGDNINKVPRNLREVGPTDREFNSDEILYIRVNNPNVTITATTPGNGQAPRPKNVQYYPNVSLQNVLNISTARESELAAIPFVANADKGVYGSTNAAGTGVTDFPVPSGSLPWGQTSDKQSFYGAEENPFIMQFSTSSNPNNPVGAIVSGDADTNYGTGTISSTNPRTVAMEPVLTVAETAPVMSALDLYYETSLCGKLEVLNSSISVGSVAPTAVTNATGTFTEGVGLNAEIGNIFKFVDGNGTNITTNIASVSIEKVVRQSTPQVSETGLFTIAAPGSGGAGNYVIKTASNYFVYRQQSSANPSSDVYIFDLRVTSSLAVTDPNYYDVVVPNAVTLTLENVAPTIKATYGGSLQALPTPIANFSTLGIPQPAVGDTSIIQLTGINGTNVSNTAAAQLEQLQFSVTAVNPASQTNDFSFSQSTLGLLNCQNLVDKRSYGVTVKLVDANGTGTAPNDHKEFITSLNFTAGAAFAPKVIKAGRTGGNASILNPTGGSGCSNSAQYFFGNEAGLSLTAAGVGLPSGFPQPNFLYNAQAVYNGNTNNYNGANNVAVAWLYQGSIQLEPKLAVNTQQNFPGDATISVRIQYRTVNPNNYQGNNWVEIASSTNLPPGSYDTYDPNAAASAFILQGSTNASSNTIIASKKYYFDQPGEYRVITTNLSGSGCNSAKFYVDFTDGDYPTGTNQGPTNPTTP
jgi:hypothetical protein